MVDPIDLMLLQRFPDLGIERLGRSQVVAERLFDHHPAPFAVLFRGQLRSPKARDHDAEEAVCDREIEEIVARGARRLVQPRQMLAQSVVGPGIVQIALKIAHAVGQPAPCGLLMWSAWNSPPPSATNW